MSTEDRMAILEAVARYSHAWDGKDAYAYAGLFTEDGVFEAYARSGTEPAFRWEGRNTIRDWARSVHSGERQGGRPHHADEQTRHNQSATVFDELTADAATTRTMLISGFVWPGDPRPKLSTSGVYTDQWRRTAEGWRLGRRTLRWDFDG